MIPVMFTVYATFTRQQNVQKKGLHWKNFDNIRIYIFWHLFYDIIKSGERSLGLIPAIPLTIIINILRSNNVYWKMVDQQVISVQHTSHYLYWTEMVHNVL